MSFVEASVPGTGGFIDTPNQRIGIHHISPIKTPADLAKMSLEGRPDLRLSDVATIVEDHQPLIGDALLKSGPGLILVVEKWPDASTLDVTKRVETALTAMAPGLKGCRLPALPASQLYRDGNRQSDDRHADRSGTHSPGADVGAVRLALGPHRRHHHSVSIIAAMLALQFAGESMNLMVVAGLAAALVLVIDDAVVFACNLKRRLAERSPSSLPRRSSRQQPAGLMARSPLRC